MATLPFDTLRSSERLHARGFSAEQAKGLAKELASFGSGNLVTKAYLEIALPPVRADLAMLKWGLAALTALTSAVLMTLLIA